LFIGIVAITELALVSITLTDFDRSLRFVTYAFLLTWSTAIPVGLIPTGMVPTTELVLALTIFTVAGSPLDHQTLLVT
jgi:hypothetical protein